MSTFKASSFLRELDLFCISYILYVHWDGFSSSEAGGMLLELLLLGPEEPETLLQEGGTSFSSFSRPSSALLLS